MVVWGCVRCSFWRGWGRGQSWSLPVEDGKRWGNSGIRCSVREGNGEGVSGGGGVSWGVGRVGGSIGVGDDRKIIIIINKWK